MEDVTRNMYLYEYNNQILIVDCGLGFADETMLGVDLLLPDITALRESLQTSKKKIVGLVLTHGHEDHIGGLPFILPQLPKFPIYATPLTAALANEKLTEYKLSPTIQTVQFTDKALQLGYFTVSFVRVTHSVPD
ncbi:MAG: MBL fold metallo-hydrolase, partial [Acidobacteriota bacterium]